MHNLLHNNSKHTIFKSGDYQKRCSQAQHIPGVTTFCQAWYSSGHREQQRGQLMSLLNSVFWMCHGPPLPGNIISFVSIKSSAEVALLSYFLAKLELSWKPVLLLSLLLDLGFKKLWHFIAAKLSPQARSFYSNYIHNKNFIILKKYSEILLMAYGSNIQLTSQLLPMGWDQGHISCEVMVLFVTAVPPLPAQYGGVSSFQGRFVL
jgi:hypothetical protein